MKYCDHHRVQRRELCKKMCKITTFPSLEGFLAHFFFYLHHVICVKVVYSGIRNE